MLTVYNDGSTKNNANQNICLAFTVDDIEKRNPHLDNKDLILSKVHKLMAAYRDGLLGGERLEELHSFNREFVPDSINSQAE
ncbi:MAG: hypothetical protein K2N41_01395, partial [Lachnospiraceae bacterium]|nr:hypothetical protein [Lachnospiraceae bacterium]